jgi:serine/threonine protein kinase
VAKFISIGEPAQDAERQALKHLVDGLPDDYTVYGNAWLVERGGSIYEIDAVVVAPHAVYVVEIKSYRGVITGNDNDWFLPEPIRSPLKLNRKTAQILATHLKNLSVQAAFPYVEGFVYLSHATDCRVVGPASAERIHTRRTILTALQDRASLWHRNGQRPPVDAHAANVIAELLTGVDRGQPPPRRIREWTIEATLDTSERYAEHVATHELTKEIAVLRVYDVDPLASEAERKLVEDRFRWEAQVLRRIGEHPHIIRAFAPFIDEARLVLPFEPFQGITLTTWLERHSAKLIGAAGLRTRVELWKRIALALVHVHRQGVVHRLLRPEIILVSDRLDPITTADGSTALAQTPDLRVCGFELAKQLYLPGKTVAISRLTDDRKRWSAPEVLRSFSDADPRSDQFSLGALLGLILVGRPLFDTTEELVRRAGAFTRVRDVNPSLKQSLDKAIATMLEIGSANRFKTLEDAIAAVEEAVSPRAQQPLPERGPDPENLPAGYKVGTDYEIIDVLGRGGLATVYAARHLVSGTTRALKVARPDAHAEELLRAEYQALQLLDHANIVKAIDITGLIPDRRTLVLARVRGVALSERLKGAPIPDEERRLFAENLLSALSYLEIQGVTHKDLKPDNLIVGPDGLTLIDFSLAGEGPDGMFGGTVLYRDPSLDRWSHVGDRYGAALCLFEMYVGRHAFDGQVPAPGEFARVEASDFDRPALVDFFTKALHPVASVRYPSAAAMRAALLQALGVRLTPTVPPGAAMAGARSASAPLSACIPDGSILHSLRNAGVYTEGQLVALAEDEIRVLRGLGNKKREQVRAIRAELKEAGVEPDSSRKTVRYPIFPALTGDEADITRLVLAPPLTQALAGASYSTVGDVATATRDELSALPSVGPSRIAQIVGALQRFADGAVTDKLPATLDAIWGLAAGSLEGLQLPVIERLYGLSGAGATQFEVAEELHTHQTAVSLDKQKALQRIEPRILDEIFTHVEGYLLSAGGILRLDEAAERLLERWPAHDDFQVDGFLRVLAALRPDRLRVQAVLDSTPNEVLTRPLIDGKALRAFIEAAGTIAEWPPQAAEGARKNLAAYLPEYPLDPLGLVVRLEPDLHLTEEGELYRSPVTLQRALQHVLHKARLPILLEDIRQGILASFSTFVHPAPEPLALQELLMGHPHCHYDARDGKVHPNATKSYQSAPSKPDALPPELTVKDPAVMVGDILRSVSKNRGYRLVVTPPEDHVKIGQSVARALGPSAVYVSFESTFFERITDIAPFDRAERFLAQKPKLRREAEAVLELLVEKHGKPGSIVVLGDTALFGVCDALHLVRRLYDLTATGGLGFWALVIPGEMRQRQPLFNELPKATVFSLEGAALPLSREIP